jgi:serine/threonine-protein kinase
MYAEGNEFVAGTILNGKYRLDAELGAGGMGAVYAAWNMQLDAPVAIKLLHASMKPRADIARRFLQEARAAAQVRHPNIVSVLDIGQDEASGALYIVQEFLQGTDLKRHLKAAGPMAPREAIELLMPVMRALGFAHSKGVVHRDLKPDNIFLSETPEGMVPKVIDFGIAKVIDEQGESPQITRTSQVMGTPHYMSPEQARGDRAVDHRADVWSLGVVLFNSLTGRFPHEGTTANLIITNIISRMPGSLAAYAPSMPPEVVALVQGALGYEPEHRYQTMEDFRHAAKACLATLDDLAEPSISVAPRPSPQVVPTTLVMPSTVAPLVVPGTRTEPPAAHGRRWLPLAAGVLLLVSVMGVVIAATQRQSPAVASQTAALHVPPRTPLAAPAPPSEAPRLTPPVATPVPPASAHESPPASPHVVRPVSPRERPRQRLRPAVERSGTTRPPTPNILY